MVQRTPEKPTSKREQTRVRILASAASVIASQGVRRLKIEDVAREAGISNGLLYYHFGDRAGLVRAALEHANEQAPSMIDTVTVCAENDVRSRLLEALLAELDEDCAVRNNSIVWNEVSASAVFDPALRDALQRVTDAWNAKVHRAIEAAVADGSVCGVESPAEVALHLTSLVDGLSLRWLAGTLALERARDHLRFAYDQMLPKCEQPATCALSR